MRGRTCCLLPRKLLLPGPNALFSLPPSLPPSSQSLARVAGLPNWSAAASPCLRSRLAIGVEATAQALTRVGEVEEKVRGIPLRGGESERVSGLVRG